MSDAPKRMTTSAALAIAFACSTAPEPPFEAHVQTGTGDLFVRVRGQGPDVVLLHGLGDSGVGWYKTEGAFRQAGYRVIIPDALGAGRSSADEDSDLSLPAHVQRLEEMLDALEVERPVLVGNSLGGSLALLFAQGFPDRVRALVLINPAAYRTGTQDGRWIWAFPGVSEAAMNLLGPELVARIGLGFNFADRTRVTAEDLEVYAAEASRPGAIRSFLLQQAQIEKDMLDAAEWERRHGSIVCPTLILWGDSDPILPMEQAHRLVTDIPDARLIVLPGVGHTPQLEAPDRVREEVVAFLQILDR